MIATTSAWHSMRFIITEIKILLVAFCLVLTVFFVTFAVCFPLIYEHRIVSSRLSLLYVGNFFYGMSLYFLLSAFFSVLMYRFVVNMRVEAKIFIITFSTIFWAIAGALATSSLYWGNVGSPHPWWIVAMWVDWMTMLIFSFLSPFLLIISALTVLIYRIYRFIRRLGKSEHVKL